MEATNHINLKYSIFHMWIHKLNTNFLLKLAIELGKNTNTNTIMQTKGMQKIKA
jgi:hypothetical protein